MCHLLCDGLCLSRNMIVVATAKTVTNTTQETAPSMINTKLSLLPFVSPRTQVSFKVVLDSSSSIKAFVFCSKCTLMEVAYAENRDECTHQSTSIYWLGRHKAQLLRCPFIQVDKQDLTETNQCNSSYHNKEEFELNPNFLSLLPELGSLMR